MLNYLKNMVRWIKLIKDTGEAVPKLPAYVSLQSGSWRLGAEGRAPPPRPQRQPAAYTDGPPSGHGMAGSPAEGKGLLCGPAICQPHWCSSPPAVSEQLKLSSQRQRETENGKTRKSRPAVL